MVTIRGRMRSFEGEVALTEDSLLTVEGDFSLPALGRFVSELLPQEFDCYSDGYYRFSVDVELTQYLKGTYYEIMILTIELVT